MKTRNPAGGSANPKRTSWRTRSQSCMPSCTCAPHWACSQRPRCWERIAAALHPRPCGSSPCSPGASSPALGRPTHHAQQTARCQRALRLRRARSCLPLFATPAHADSDLSVRSPESPQISPDLPRSPRVFASSFPDHLCCVRILPSSPPAPPYASEPSWGSGRGSADGVRPPGTTRPGTPSRTSNLWISRRTTA